MNSTPHASRSELARRVGISPERLSRLFTAELGTSLVEVRNRKRVARFIELVDAGASNLAAAALDAGFGSYPQFHRVFSRMVGHNPTTYLTRERARCQALVRSENG